MPNVPMRCVFGALVGILEEARLATAFSLASATSPFSAGMDETIVAFLPLAEASAVVARFTGI